MTPPTEEREALREGNAGDFVARSLEYKAQVFRGAGNTETAAAFAEAATLIRARQPGEGRGEPSDEMVEAMFDAMVSFHFPGSLPDDVAMQGKPDRDEIRDGLRKVLAARAAAARSDREEPSAEYRPASSVGERCRICPDDARYKVEEVVFSDDPLPVRHPYTAYLCDKHFRNVMGLSVFAPVSPAPADERERSDGTCRACGADLYMSRRRAALAAERPESAKVYTKADAEAIAALAVAADRQFRVAPLSVRPPEDGATK